MRISSSAFSHEAAIPLKYAFNQMGCSGENVSPPLQLDDVPDGTKSFAIVMHDPDAPTSGGFYHWVMFDIPGDRREIPEKSGRPGAIENAVLGHTDYGSREYGGPCPPPGPVHRYNITVHALSIERLGLDETTTGAKLEFVAAQHTLAKATISGTFARSQ